MLLCDVTSLVQPARSSLADVTDKLRHSRVEAGCITAPAPNPASLPKTSSLPTCQHTNRCTNTLWHLCVFVLSHLWTCLVIKHAATRIFEGLKTNPDQIPKESERANAVFPLKQQDTWVSMRVRTLAVAFSPAPQVDLMLHFTEQQLTH